MAASCCSSRASDNLSQLWKRRKETLRIDATKWFHHSTSLARDLHYRKFIRHLSTAFWVYEMIHSFTQLPYQSGNLSAHTVPDRSTMEDFATYWAHFHLFNRTQYQGGLCPRPKELFCQLLALRLQRIRIEGLCFFATFGLAENMLLTRGPRKLLAGKRTLDCGEQDSLISKVFSPKELKRVRFIWSMQNLGAKFTWKLWTQVCTHIGVLMHFLFQWKTNHRIMEVIHATGQSSTRNE